MSIDKYVYLCVYLYVYLHVSPIAILYLYLFCNTTLFTRVCDDDDDDVLKHDLLHTVVNASCFWWSVLVSEFYFTKTYTGKRFLVYHVDVRHNKNDMEKETNTNSGFRRNFCVFRISLSSCLIWFI